MLALIRVHGATGQLEPNDLDSDVSACHHSARMDGTTTYTTAYLNRSQVPQEQPNNIVEFDQRNELGIAVVDPRDLGFLHFHFQKWVSEMMAEKLQSSE